MVRRENEKDVAVVAVVAVKGVRLPSQEVRARTVRISARKVEASQTFLVGTTREGVELSCVLAAGHAMEEAIAVPSVSSVGDAPRRKGSRVEAIAAARIIGVVAAVQNVPQGTQKATA